MHSPQARRLAVELFSLPSVDERLLLPPPNKGVLGLTDALIGDAGEVPANSVRIVRSSLEEAENVLHSSEPGAAFEAIRRATEVIGRLPRESDVTRQASIALKAFLATFARMTGDLEGNAAAVQTAARLFMTDPYAWSVENRMRLSTEVALLLSRSGAGELAACLMSQVVAFADTHADGRSTVATSVMRSEVCIEARELQDPPTRKELVRLADPGGQFPRFRGHVAQGMDLVALRSLRRSAERIGDEYLIARARLLVCRVEHRHGGSCEPALRAAEDLCRVSRQHGSQPMIANAQIQLARTRVAAGQLEAAADALRMNVQGCDATNGPVAGELDFLFANIAFGRGDASRALSSYSKYAQTAIQVRGFRERLLQGHCLPAAVLAMSLPMVQPPEFSESGPAGVLSVCSDAIRIHLCSPSLISLSAVASIQGLSLRRLQQAFKSTGLPTPAVLLKSLTNSDTA